MNLTRLIQDFPSVLRVALTVVARIRVSLSAEKLLSLRLWRCQNSGLWNGAGNQEWGECKTKTWEGPASWRVHFQRLSIIYHSCHKKQNRFVSPRHQNCMPSWNTILDEDVMLVYELRDWVNNPISEPSFLHLRRNSDNDADFMEWLRSLQWNDLFK